VPELDGYELCAIIRSDPSTKALPFLLLTAPGGPQAGAAARAGVDLVLGGTFDASDVVNRVQRLVSSGGHHA
jgi:CheY-like chemotaxis protein